MVFWLYEEFKMSFRLELRAFFLSSLFFSLLGRKNGLDHMKKHVKFIFMQDVLWRTKYTVPGRGR